MNYYYFGLIEAKAQESNGWRLIAAVQLGAGGNGFVPNGVALVKREPRPLAPAGREYATVGWYVQPDTGAGFESGNYDLTAEDAWADFNERAKSRIAQGFGEL